MSIEKAKSHRAEVRLRNQKVGLLTRKTNQTYVFKYDEKYLQQKDAVAISLKIPLKEGEFFSERLHPFFDNLIMEGWLLNQAEKNLHIDKKNRWGLLMLVGANPIGAVSVHALDDNGICLKESVIEDEENAEPFSVQIPRDQGICSFCLMPIKGSDVYHSTCYKKLWGTSRALFVKLDKNNPIQTFSKTIYNGSISGAQRKGLFCLKKNELIVGSEDSMYILKPDGDYPELPANEHLTMAAAKILKFEVPPIGLVKIDKVGLVLVIKRFDRNRSKEKLLVEDMAQIYEEASEDKYSLSHEKVGLAIKEHTQAGPLNLQDFFRRIIFCFVTANGDMHLKNWSLLEMDEFRGIYKLCPVYDWLNTRIALPQEKVDLAIPLKGKQRNMQKSYFANFGTEDLELSADFVDSVFVEVKDWKKEFQKLIPRSFLSDKMKISYLTLLDERCALFE